MKHQPLCTKAILICLIALLLNQPLQAQCWKTITTAPLCGNTFGIATNGRLWAWGDNYSSQLGTGNNNSQNSPKQIGTASNWQLVASGYSHTMAIKTDGTLWAWGNNGYGEFGIANTFNTEASPIQIGSATNWLSVSCGFGMTIALKTNGTLWSSGFNNVGQLGIGNNIDQNSFVQIGSATDWKSLNCGVGNHTLALKNNGTLWAWGHNQFGQLGIGNTIYQNSPIQIGNMANWQSASGGYLHSMAIKTDGTLWAWGHNDWGQLGDGTITVKISPIQIGIASNWKMVVCGSYHTIGIKTDGTLWAWGRNDGGQLGDGTTINRASPVQIGSASNWQSIAGGDGHTVALKTDGSLWTWGLNHLGQLGDGTWLQKIIPTAISCPSVLPVTYSGFTAIKQGSNVLLNWQTATELNNAYFIIQHSTNGTAWENIGSVNTNNGSYNFKHTTPVSSNNYYRLQQVDKDGKSSFSDVRSINMNINNGVLSIYPNPIVGNRFVADLAKEITKPVNYGIYSAIGVLVQQGVIKQKQQTIDVNNLAKGMYLLKLSDGQTASVMKQ